MATGGNFCWPIATASSAKGTADSPEYGGMDEKQPANWTKLPKLPPDNFGDMEQRQFTIRDLFLSVTLISVGIAGWVLWWVLAKRYELFVVVFPPCWVMFLGGPAFVGAGIGALFREKLRGAFIGFFLFWLVVMIFALISRSDLLLEKLRS